MPISGSRQGMMVGLQLAGRGHVASCEDMPASTQTCSCERLRGSCSPRRSGAPATFLRAASRTSVHHQGKGAEKVKP